jgi:WD40 repeat protein
LFVTGSNDRKIYLYEGKDCNELKEIKSATPHERSVTSVAWFDDKTFASSSNDTTVKLWTVNDEEGLLKTLRVEEKPHEIEEM